MAEKMSLAKEFSSAGHEVTLFLPEFKCTSLSKIKNYKEIDTFSANIIANAFVLCGVHILCTILTPSDQPTTYPKRQPAIENSLENVLVINT